MDESRIYRVSEITEDIRELVEERWSRVRIRGECSNVTHHRSGHVYFVLKEANHELRCVLFKGYAQWLRFRLEDGLEVIVTGRITVFTQRGQLQCVVTTVEPAGQGTLFLALERLKNRLQAEGLFRNDRKRPLPPLPQRVGVLTSDTGAAIRDILQILERRAPYVEVLLRPTLVQGSRAAADLVAGIDYMESRVRPDCLIVGRGGGSIEDLWCFNEESVVRAIAACSLPVISAVGHETDVTLADLAADVRAPTPSAAAELVAPSREDLLRRLEQSTHKLQQGMQRRLERCWQGLDLWEQRLQAQQPLRQLERQEERLRQWEDRMRLAVRQSLGQARDRWTHYASALELLNPHNILERGYALALAETEDRLLESVRDIAPGDPFRLRLADGEFPARRDPQRQ